MQGTRGPPIAELIDGLLASEKTLGGEPDWQDTYFDEAKLMMPLLIDGVSVHADFVVLAYPLTGHSKFRLLLNAPRCVWRVDHVHDEPHVNSFDRPSDLEEYDFCAPHYHAWADNRRFSTHATLPDRLENARILPPGLRSFDSVLRWFCGETNIVQPLAGLITLPRRTSLV